MHGLIQKNISKPNSEVILPVCHLSMPDILISWTNYKNANEKERTGFLNLQIT